MGVKLFHIIFHAVMSVVIICILLIFILPTSEVKIFQILYVTIVSAIMILAILVLIDPDLTNALSRWFTSFVPFLRNNKLFDEVFLSRTWARLVAAWALIVGIIILTNLVLSAMRR